MENTNDIQRFIDFCNKYKITLPDFEKLVNEKGGDLIETTISVPIDLEVDDEDRFYYENLILPLPSRTIVKARYKQRAC